MRRLAPAMLLTLLLATTNASAAVLVDQMNNQGEHAVGSTNQMAPNDNKDTQAADDFIVDAASKGWSIDKVEVAGGPGPVLSGVTVFIYPNASGLPSDTPLATRTVLPSSGLSDGNFVMTLDPPVKLDPGTYWLSVQANAAEVTDDFWAWEQRTVQFNNIWAFRNPGDFYSTGCKTWTSSNICYPPFPGAPPEPDLMFRLSGTTVAPPPAPPPGPTGPSGTSGPTGPSGPTLTPTLVDKLAPVQTAKVAKSASLKKGSLSVTVTESENSTVQIAGTVAVPKLSKVYRLGPVSKQVPAGKPTAIALKLNRQTLKVVRKALARHRRISAKLTISGSDAAKNTTVTKRTIRLKP
jgi:hypothetical protein